MTDGPDTGYQSWQEPPEDYDPEVRELNCYMCLPLEDRLGPDKGPLRKVVRTRTVEAHRDPTEAYLLECGHWVI